MAIVLSSVTMVIFGMGGGVVSVRGADGVGMADGVGVADGEGAADK